MNNELLVKTIRNICAENGITVSQLEKTLNFSPSLISRWVKTSPSLDKIVDIADYFNMQIDNVIGRTIKSNNVSSEEFIDTLYSMTINNNITWEVYTDRLLDLESDKRFNFEDDGYENKELFVSSYKSGFFLLYCQYDEEKGAIAEIDIQIYIRPDKKSKAVLQDIDEKKAYQLWSYIHTSFYGTLDEVKAEELKNNFVNNKITNIDSYTDEQLQQITSEMLNIEPDLKAVFEKINTPEFQKLQKIINSQEFQQGIEIATRLSKYYNSNNKRAGD